MKAPVRLLLFCSGILLAGCGVARTSYHVVTAPVRLVTHHGDKPSEPATTTTTTTTTASSSDVTAPGIPVVSPSPPLIRRQAGTEHVASVSPSPSPRTERKGPVEAKAKTASSPHVSPAPDQFPTAKPVPGKPGYVFDPFNSNGGYIDVSGYAPGSKVKDPTTKKIFIVP